MTSLFLACSLAGGQPPGAPTTSTEPLPPPPLSPPGESIPLGFGAATLAAHVADTPREREVGLMNVAALLEDEGMIFVYPLAAPRYYWMKDTLVPLSIAYVGADGRIVRIADMEPKSTVLTPSGAPALYAIEARKGWFAAHGVAVGDSVGGLPAPSRE